MNDVMQTDRQASADILPLRLLLSFSDQDYEKCFVTFYSDFYWSLASCSPAA